jgi:hypothetical protein
MITGELLCGGKLVSVLQPILSHKDKIIIKAISDLDNSSNYRENRKSSVNVKLLAELTQPKIEFIEKERQRNYNNSALFAARLRVANSRIATIENADQYQTEISSEELLETIEIQQNRWIKVFSPYLGLGEYYLIELYKPNSTISNTVWSELYEDSINNLNQMKESLRIGDWQRTIEISRQFFENIKVGDNKPGNKLVKNELKEKMLELHYDEEGIQNLFDGIWQFFEYTSKFIHSKNKTGYAKPIPIAKKSDAFFIYSLATNLINLIYDKLNASR